ncbi:hypothetical protein PybrP1_007997 [[Pythium] brassicae (nom. inval.)]|nr:hypothetical protein PybrP1_007997 [[Pythium] brassicae (nom. inval.)]
MSLLPCDGRGTRVTPFGPTLRATEPNELHHFDFLAMMEGEGGLKYVLVLKVSMSWCVELVACDPATAEQTDTSLLDWLKRFGVGPVGVRQRHILREHGDRTPPEGGRRAAAHHDCVRTVGKRHSRNRELRGFEARQDQTERASPAPEGLAARHTCRPGGAGRETR